MPLFPVERVKIDEKLIFCNFHLVFQQIASWKGQTPLDGRISEDEIFDGCLNRMRHWLLLEVGEFPVSFDGIGGGKGREGEKKEEKVG